MKFKFLKMTLSVVIFSIALLNTIPVKAKPVTPQKLQVSGFSNIVSGMDGEVVASRKNKVGTKQKLYVNFSPKNTKNIGIHVQSSDSSILKVEKVNKHKFQFKALKAGKATLTITSQYKSTSGKTLSIYHEVNVEKDKSFHVKQDKRNHFLITLTSSVDKITASDLKIIDTDGKEMSIKSTLLSEDKKQISVTTNENFLNQKEYSVSFDGFSTSFTAMVEQIFPTSLKIKTKEVKKGEPTAPEVELLDENGNNITEEVDKTRLNITAKVKNGTFDQTSNLLTIEDYNGKADITARYTLPNGSSLSATSEVYVILDEEYQKLLAELAELDFLENLPKEPKGPKIESMEFIDDNQDDTQKIILTMTNKIEEKDKVRYLNKKNYDITLVDNFKKTPPEPISINGNISIENKQITIILSIGANHSQVHLGDITLHVKTKGELPFSSKTFSKDLRPNGGITIRSDRSNLFFNSGGNSTLKIVFNTKIRYKGSDKVSFAGEEGSVSLDETKKVLTIQFTKNLKDFYSAHEDQKYEISGIESEGIETGNSIIRDGMLYKLVLTCKKDEYQHNAFRTSFFPDLKKVQP